MKLHAQLVKNIDNIRILTKRENEICGKSFLHCAMFITCFCSVLQEMHPESHARHDLLDKDKLWQKLKQVQEYRRSLKRQLKSAEQILQTAVQRDSVEIPKDLHKDFKQIILENRDKLQEGSLQQIFWDQQDQCLKRSNQGYRWHPAVIRLCIALHAKSASAYRSLTESGVLTLPSTKTLRDYTYFTSPQ